MGVGKRKWTKTDGSVCETYIVRWSDSEGRHIKTFAKKKDADAFDAETKLNKSSGKHVALPRKLTVSEAGEKWIANVEHARNGRVQTLTQYRQHLRDHIGPMFGNRRLVDLTRADCEQFRNDLLTRKMVRKAREGETAGQKLSRSTALKIWVSFKSLMRHNGRGAVVDGIDFERKEAHGIQEAKDYPTIAEVGRMAAHIPDLRDQVVFKVLTTCGPRGGELRGLRWRDVNLETRRLTVNQSADRFGGTDLPKTQHGRRTLPLPGETADALASWKKAQRPASEDDLVFSKSTGEPIHHHTLVRALQDAQKSAGVVDAAGKPKYALHAFRHFFASWCLAPKPMGRDISPPIVSKWLGHASFAITQAIYHHLFHDVDDVGFDDATASLFQTADKTPTRRVKTKQKLSLVK